MTKVRFHGPIAGFSGAMDEMVFADTKKKNRTVAYMKKHHPATEAQKNHQTHFKDSAARAQAALENPSLRAFYQAIAEDRDITAHLAAFVDFLVVPTIKPLDLSKYKGQVGDIITIRATDDIGLADLDVALITNDGTRIEQGKAIEQGARTGTWIYTATQPVPLGTDIFIEVVGVDHAGTEAKITESPRVGEDD